MKAISDLTCMIDGDFLHFLWHLFFFSLNLTLHDQTCISIQPDFFKGGFGAAESKHTDSNLQGKHSISQTQTTNTHCVSSSVAQSKVIGRQQFVFTPDRKLSSASLSLLSVCRSSSASTLLRKNIEKCQFLKPRLLPPPIGQLRSMIDGF